MNKITIEKESEYIVSTQSIISSYDRKILTRLYQPLIGSFAFSTYLSLQSELEFDKTISSLKHTISSLIKLMNISLDEFLLAKTKLEGVGLIKTYHHKKENYFLFTLFSPLSPKDFFDNPLLDSMLLKTLGQEEYDRNKQYFTFAKIPNNDLEEISDSFNDAYEPYNTRQTTSNNRQVKKQNADFKLEFDFEAFYAKLKEFQVSKNSITKELESKIPYLSVAYNINALDMADLVTRAQIKNGIADLKSVKALCIRNSNNKNVIGDNNNNSKTNNTTLNQLLTAYDSFDPAEFVLVKLGSPLAKYEEDYIFQMMNVYNLSSKIINVALDYMFEKTSNTFVKNYLDALCASLARKKPNNSYEAYQLLRNNNRSIINDESKVTNEDEEQNELLKNIELLKQKRGEN